MGKRILFLALLLIAIGIVLLVYKTPSSPSESSVMVQNTSPEEETIKKSDNPHMSFELPAVGKSSEYTHITLQEDGKGNIHVTLDMKNYPKNAIYPAHIHSGSCPNPGSIKYPLTTVKDGKSQTTINNVTIIDLLDSPHAIAVHQSSDPKIYVACKDIELKKK